MTSSALPAGGARSAQPGRSFAFLALIAAAALGASSFRLVLAPGFELYLGPLFYLAAYRIWGVRVGLVAAFLTMLPSWWWWGHVLSIVIAIGHILFIHRLRIFTRSLAITTIFYQLTVGGLIGLAFMQFYIRAPGEIMALVFLRKLLNDVLMAALVDLGLAFLRFDRLAREVRRRRLIALGELLPSIITLVVITSALVLFAANARRFPEDFARYSNEARLQVELSLRRLEDDGRRVTGLHRARTDVAVFYVVPAASEPLLRKPATLARLDCQRVDDDSAVTGPNDRNTFVYWLNACVEGQVEIGGRRYFYIHSARGLAEAVYHLVLLQMLGPSFILLVAVLLELFLTRALRRSLAAWREVIEGFGKPGVGAPSGMLFAEFSRPIAAVVDANNRFAAVMEERKRLANAVLDLKREVDLRLAADIRFERATGRLIFQEVDLERPEQPVTIDVHPNDRVAFDGVAGDDEGFVEFRVAESVVNDWYLLSVRERVAPGHWRSGWMVRLRQSKLERHGQLQQARLVELGGMASAISHELKQPLFTISLSADNGRLLLDQGSADSLTRASAKFDRISEQVARARDIIARISRYSRVEDEDSEPVDIGDVLNTALAFMRPILIEQNVNARLDLPPERVDVLASRVGLEQILVNALQNAIDAIVSARRDELIKTGEIRVSAALHDGGLRIQVADNGTGLAIEQPNMAFDAFVTTKPSGQGTGLGLYISRQIALEIGGRIALDTRAAPETGAVLTLDLPDFVVLRPDRQRCRLQATHADG